MSLLLPPDPPSTGVTDQLSWQQWDVYLRSQEAQGYLAWLAADQAWKTADQAWKAQNLVTSAQAAQGCADQGAGMLRQAAAAEAMAASQANYPKLFTATDAELTERFTAALLSDWDWLAQSKAAPTNVVATAASMKDAYRKLFPLPAP
jgi:hypothetical protein